MYYQTEKDVVIALQKQVGCFNHRVVALVADKLERQWSLEVCFDVELKTNCIRQPQSYFPVHLATTIHALNSLITAVLPSPGYNFLTATLKCICNDSFIDVLSVLWL